jgi:putative nucleotidyltransferase with HDIG domain
MPPTAFNPKLAEQVKSIVLKKIEGGTLELPTFPSVALRCLELLKKRDFSFKSVAGVLEQDPILVARVMRMSTSAAFATAGKNPSVVECLTRLGASAVKTVVVEASAQKIFSSRDPRILEATKRLWQHSGAVANLARDVVALSGGADSEGAYLAGLLHDVGKPIVATTLLDAEQQISELRGKPWIGSAEWLWVVAQTHREVGVALATKWKLPETACGCIRECSEFDPSNRGAISNAVCFANALAKVQGLAVEGTDVEDAKALVMIGRSLLGVDDAVIERLVAPLSQKVAALYD